MTFWGSFRGGHELEHHVHESPWTMLVALVVLAIGSAVAGFVHIPGLVEPVFRLAEEPPHPIPWLPIVATATALAGIGLAYYAYVMRPDVPGQVAGALRPVVRILEEKYGFDLAYDGFARKVVVGGSEGLWRGVDVRIIDGLVNGTAGLVDAVARQARYVQSGLVRAYVLLILGGAVALVGYILWS
jgi:NADH-quinone oxidoreductase subunit L